MHARADKTKRKGGRGVKPKTEEPCKREHPNLPAKHVPSNKDKSRGKARVDQRGAGRKDNPTVDARRELIGNGRQCGGSQERVEKRMDTRGLEGANSGKPE